MADTDMNAALREISEQLSKLAERVGEPSSDGKGGTGLVGQLSEVRSDVAALKSLRDRGLGFLAAITLLGAILILGLKSWVAQVAKAAS